MPIRHRRATRLAAATLAALAALSTLSACGEQTTPSADDPTIAAEATTNPPTEPPPLLPLDDSALRNDMAKLSDADRAIVDHYLQAAKGELLGEGTWIMAAPITVDEAVTRLFGPDPRLMDEADEKALRRGNGSGYSVVQVGNGVIAYEETGFADPPRRLLAALSQDGVASAVATENIESMTRFGYARDGEIVFDNAEYAFVDDLDQIPAEVRDLAALTYDDLTGPMVATADWFYVAMAMAEKVTGLRADPGAQRVRAQYPVPLPWGAMEDE